MKILSLTYAGNVEWFCHLLGGDCVIDLHEHYHKQSYRNRCLIMTANGVVPLSVQVAKPDNLHKPAMRDVRIDYSKRWQHQHWTSIVSAYRNSPYFDHYAGALEPFYRRRFDFLADLNAGLLETLLTALGSDLRPRFSERYIDVTDPDRLRLPAPTSGAHQGSGYSAVGVPTDRRCGEPEAAEGGAGVERAEEIIDLRDALSPKKHPAHLLRSPAPPVGARYDAGYLAAGLASPSSFAPRQSSNCACSALGLASVPADPRFTPQHYYQVFSERMPFAPNLSVVDLVMCEGPGALEILRRSYRY